MNQIPRHKVFISYYDEDREHKDRFVRMMGKRIVDRSVKVGNIDDRNIKTSTIRQKIRDEFIRDATATIVLIGPCTWQRKHVDWEIGSSLRKTKKNPRCGLLGILLPNHPDYGKRKYNLRLIPPRLADNCLEVDTYANIYDWPRPWTPAKIALWIHQAFARRNEISPNNHRKQFARNRAGKCSSGWKR